MLRTIPAAFVLGATICLSPSAHALFLNPQGIGQVLVFPYYTINGSNATLISLVNTSVHGKALKVRFHEGYDGREVLQFNVYLAPLDSWVAEVADRTGSAAGPASLFTSDTSCTAPSFTPLAAGSMRFLDMTSTSYAGTNPPGSPTGNSDGGPTTPDRTREGHFDVIEMGEVIDATRGSLSALAPNSPGGCAQIQGAWNASGYWTANSSVDMSPPGGGIYGSAMIIDVAQGTAYTESPAAIDGFSVVVRHTSPDSPAPDLDSANQSGSGVVSALVPVSGRMLQLDYVNPIDAVSALFMSDSLDNEFDRDPALGALTDWVVTAPTKRFYVDPAHVGQTAAAPFERAFLATYWSGSLTSTDGTVLEQWGSAWPYACASVNPLAYDRSGRLYTIGELGAATATTSASLLPCLETSVLTFATQVTGSGRSPLSVFGSGLVDATDPGDHVSRPYGGVDSLPPNGVMRLDLAHDAAGNPVSQHRLSAATNGDVLLGLPVVGFRATNYVNAGVTPGILANYSGLVPLHSSVTCVHGDGPCQ
ncbi:MAG TPA: hypothetical protein VFI49_09070 [Rudaea sp.]|nr:hypothetical protein [Rudaea sp.]